MTPQWLKIELREHETLLSAAVDAGDTTLPVSSSYGWPVTGTGIIEGDTFSYTADGNDLLLGAGIASGHVWAGATVSDFGRGDANRLAGQSGGAEASARV